MPEAIEPTPQTADIKAMGARWLFGQPATTVLLFCILGGGAWFAKYLMDVAVPKHLNQIQQGYEKVQQEGIRESSAARAESLETRKTFEKTLDRFERMTQKVCPPGKAGTAPKPDGDLN